MGWYNDPDFSWEEFSAQNNPDAPAACSIKNKSKTSVSAVETKKTTTASSSPSSATATTSSGNTACPLPKDATPPPPPPDVDYIYHLCQETKWVEACKSKTPYFPPTYLADGKFTRMTVSKDDLVDTANTYYKSHSGYWIVLEISCQTLYSLGIAILAQDAPESKGKKQPVKCLQVFGGISTTLPSLIHKVYPMKRSGKDGTFLKLLPGQDPVNSEDDCGCGDVREDSSSKKKKKAAATVSRKNNDPKPEQPVVKKEKRSSFFSRLSSKSKGKN